jgi:hypothetical protein
MLSELMAPDGFIGSSVGELEGVLRSYYGDVSWKVGVVRQHIGGLDITESCLVHDWMRAKALGDIRLFREADRYFLYNMLVGVDGGGGEMFRGVRRQLAWEMYCAAVKGERDKAALRPAGGVGLVELGRHGR